MNRWVGFRDWLKRNKEPLEFFITALLTVNALLLAYNTNLLQDEANQIASYQTAIMKQEHQPIFNFKIDLVEDEYSTNDQFIISNEGEPISYFDAQTYEFVYCQSHRKGEATIMGRIPLLRYYSLKGPTENSSGVLMRFTSTDISEGNYIKLRQLDMQFSRDFSGYFEFERYVKVSYYDALDEPHTDVYEVDWHGGKKLEKAEGASITKEWDNKVQQHISLDLDEASADVLYEKLLLLQNTA